MFAGSCRHGKDIRVLWYHKALEGQVENVTFMMYVRNETDRAYEITRRHEWGI